MWKGHIFVLYPHKVVVFDDSNTNANIDNDLLSGATCTQIYYFEYGAYVEAFVLKGERPARVSGNHSENTLHLCLRCGRGSVFFYKIHFNDLAAPRERFSFEQTGFFKEAVSDPCYYKATKLCMGSSHRRVIVHALDDENWRRSIFYTAPIIAGDGKFDFGQTTVLRVDDLPFLYELTSLDFDDGLGILVFGMRNGEVYVRSFGSMLPDRYIRKVLPIRNLPSDFKVSHRFVRLYLRFHKGLCRRLPRLNCLWSIKFPIT